MTKKNKKKTMPNFLQFLILRLTHSKKLRLKGASAQNFINVGTLNFFGIISSAKTY